VSGDENVPVLVRLDDAIRLLDLPSAICDVSDSDGFGAPAGIDAEGEPLFDVGLIARLACDAIVARLRAEFAA
jgi:hypothetical protein